MIPVRKLASSMLFVGFACVAVGCAADTAEDDDEGYAFADEEGVDDSVGAEELGPEEVATSQQAATTPCWGFVRNGRYYYRNCSRKARSVRFRFKYQLDWTYCIPAGQTREIRQAWRVAGYSVVKYHDGSYCPSRL
jgi:hypothetical protein